VRLDDENEVGDQQNFAHRHQQHQERGRWPTQVVPSGRDGGVAAVSGPNYYVELPQKARFPGLDRETARDVQIALKDRQLSTAAAATRQKYPGHGRERR
jgi:hypothetical protein